MITPLTEIEGRIIGVLLEKEVTTPEQYPLSLNGLTTGCNQKSNREPVMQLTETDVQNGLDALTAKRLIMADERTSRVTKYKHKFCNTEFGSYQFSEQQVAILCLLLLRGPQTPGELRTRSNRLAQFAQVSDVEDSLQALGNYQGEVLVKQLPRQPGKRESRYMHCFTSFTDEVPAEALAANSTSGELSPKEIALEKKVQVLEEQVQYLIQQLDTLLQKQER